MCAKNKSKYKLVTDEEVSFTAGITSHCVTARSPRSGAIKHFNVKRRISRITILTWVNYKTQIHQQKRSHKYVLYFCSAAYMREVSFVLL